MQTITVMSRKGGAGKTTLAVNLMLTARMAGIHALLADADPLASATEVLSSRSDADSLLVTTRTSKLFALRDAARRAGAQLLVIDTPAGPEADVVDAVGVADLALCIARPTYVDLSAAVRSVAIIRQLSKDGLIVLAQCPTARRGIEPPAVVKALAALRFASLPVAPVHIRARTDYQQAFGLGKSVGEYDPSGLAAAEMQMLFEHLWLRVAGQDLKVANDHRARRLRSPG